MREYRACIAADPNRVEARSNFGVVLASLGRYQEAIEQYRAAMKLATPEVAQRLRFNLALAYYKSFQTPGGHHEFETLHAAGPTDCGSPCCSPIATCKPASFSRPSTC